MAETSRRARLTAEARLEQLVEEATDLIGRHGYHRFSIAALAERCGLTRAGVLHHIGSKEQLLVHILDARDKDASKSLGANPAGVPIPRSVREALDEVVRRNAGQREIVRLYSTLSVESIEPEHPAHAYFLNRQQRSIAELSALFEASGGSGQERAVEVLAFLDGLQVLWLRDESVDLWDRWAHFADRVVGQALPTEASSR